jgi:hypothetical protein
MHILTVLSQVVEVTYSPQLKLGASTVNTVAKANLRLTAALVAQRCPAVFDVDRRVVVSIDREATIAIQNSISQGEVMTLPTSRTGFCRWRKAINFDDVFAALEGHPFQDRQEAAKAQITHFATPQGFHALQVQVLKIQHIVLITQPMRQLEMMVAPFVGDVGAVLCQRSPRSFVAVRAFDFTRKLAVQLAGFADTLREKLRAGIGSTFIIGQEGFEAKVEAAAFTRAGFANDPLLNHAEDQPQPPDGIAFDGERFDFAAHLAMFHKFVDRSVNRDGVILNPIARLRESEGRVFLRLPELGSAFGKSSEKALVGIVHTPTDILAGLRVQILPQGKALGVAQFQDMVIHPSQRNVLLREAIVAPLQGDEVVPDRRRDKNLVSQLAIFFIAAIQAVLVGFADFDYACHALTPTRLEGWRMFQHRGQQPSLYPTSVLFANISTPYIPRPKGRGFTALFDKALAEKVSHLEKQMAQLRTDVDRISKPLAESNPQAAGELDVATGKSKEVTP